MVPAAAAPLADTQVFRPESRRGAAGFYHVAQNQAGQWWLLDPKGAPTWLRGVNGVLAAGASGDTGVPRDSAARLRSWGFNAVGIDSDVGRDDGLAFLASV